MTAASIGASSQIFNSITEVVLTKIFVTLISSFSVFSPPNSILTSSLMPWLLSPSFAFTITLPFFFFSFSDHNSLLTGTFLGTVGATVLCIICHDLNYLQCHHLSKP
ncbi:hypothetical protein HGRIS_014303 [Hohenbuehelia grisea]|uniref:Uncharacterized protein n=1 Tax=Hohenbuehelia grisea TaxID=104357 RepID=A0ABR3JUR1_9AGAR